jgi:hypothetical protein
MITHEKNPCWVIDLAPGEPDECHFPNRTDAEEELARFRKEEDRYAVATVRRLALPCWTVTCDGECEYVLDEDDDGVIHFASAAEAEDYVRDVQWRMLPDRVHVFCEDDAPGDGQVPPPTPEQQEKAGQLRLPGVLA